MVVMRIAKKRGGKLVSKAFPNSLLVYITTVNKCFFGTYLHFSKGSFGKLCTPLH